MMRQKFSNTAECKAVFRAAMLIFGKYVLMGIVLSVFNLIILFFNHVYFDDSKIGYLRFASVTFFVAFVIIGIMQAMIFFTRYYRNKN